MPKEQVCKLKNWEQVGVQEHIKLQIIVVIIAVISNECQSFEVLCT